MGVVYRATDLSLNRPIAIKFLSSEVVDEAHRRRFQQGSRDGLVLEPSTYTDRARGWCL